MDTDQGIGWDMEKGRLSGGLGTMNGNYWWQPREDGAECKQAVFVVPRGFAREVSPPVLSRAWTTFVLRVATNI